MSLGSALQHIRGAIEDAIIFDERNLAARISCLMR